MTNILQIWDKEISANVDTISKMANRTFRHRWRIQEFSLFSAWLSYFRKPQRLSSSARLLSSFFFRNSKYSRIHKTVSIVSMSNTLEYSAKTIVSSSTYGVYSSPLLLWWRNSAKPSYSQLASFFLLCSIRPVGAEATEDRSISSAYNK